VTVLVLKKNLIYISVLNKVSP